MACQLMQHHLDALVKCLIDASARTWLWVLNCMSDVQTLWYNTRIHWYIHLTFSYRLCDWISLNWQWAPRFIGFIFDLVKAFISNTFILIVVVSWLIDIMRDSRLPCFRNFGMQTFHCVNECISEIIRSVWNGWGRVD